MAVDTSLIRECLELILMLADALDRERATLRTKVLQHPLPVTPEISHVEFSGSQRVEAVHD